ncbi:DUF4177 domain-containing protein [Maribacter hydrothermalis]|uniref:Uncharacterized protein n=1 Tax=Maribacter hydrothermalis TaxID=1836467 RepID=A0A1B7ZEY7_9FLAO|nr:DUF4177 domain-containing protein [Maribacter hydrothermalis]APQ17627.1 hypothetical protein BTR34_09920 [Maribacter hydrothermalis]OBR42101.1 hypothetical protein A9200_01550 [Maribacter hydrothermalis]
MYEYHYVKIGLGGFFTSKPNSNNHEIIASKAKEGGRFVQIFAPASTGYGDASYFELIFEKKME